MKLSVLLVFFGLVLVRPVEGQSTILSMQDDQVFHVGDPSSPVSRIAITSNGSSITATQNIRILIHEDSHLEWDTSVTYLSISGDASYKVNPVVSYPNSKTLLIDVLSTFSLNQFIH
ncbi:MAG: hypothetical protein QF645_12400, partial [Planctomycetota bacterium]|nr:hypothetical protein [Planctomycetota bacterium]